MRSPHIDVYCLIYETNATTCGSIHRGTGTRRNMSGRHGAAEDQHEPGVYEICIKGHLDDRWAGRFEGLTITRADTGETLLTGRVADQAALHGWLRKVRDLALPLVSVREVESLWVHSPQLA